MSPRASRLGIDWLIVAIEKTTDCTQTTAVDRSITAQPFAGRPRAQGLHSTTKKKYPFQLIFCRKSTRRWYKTTCCTASCSPPASRARGPTRTLRRAHLRRRNAPTPAPDHDGPPLRRRGRDSGAPPPRRRGVRRAGPHRGRGLARVPRRASGAFVAGPPAGSLGSAGRRGSAGMRGRRASPSRARRRAAASSRLNPRVRPTATITAAAQVPPQGRQTYANNQLPTHTKGQASQLVKQVRDTNAAIPPPDAGSPSGAGPPPRLRLDQ